MAGKAKDTPLVDVLLGNGTATSGGLGPGVVSVPADEARGLIRQGLAVRMDGA